MAAGVATRAPRRAPRPGRSRRQRSAPASHWQYLQHDAPPMGYVPGLDGIRALAVIGVLVFHGIPSWMPGGFLGVDVFFVLSGFLISTLLLEQLAARGRIDFRVFYIHRARRLLPALVAMLALSALLVVLFAHDAASQFRRSVLPSLLYVANWSFINDQQSYFEAIGRPPLLQHLWSLAIEEQFYLLWPLVLLVLYRRRGRLGVGKGALWTALASTLLMAFLSFLWNMPSYEDASRLYFGTDTHAMSLLVGAALAAVFRPGAMPRTLSPPRRLALTGVGVAATALVLLAYLQVHESDDWLYRGGFLLFAGACAVMIAVAAHPAGLLGPALGWAPLRYIGTRSYGLYLYHWPIFVVTRPDIDVPFGPVPTFALQLVLTFLVAEASYRYLEIPIRRGTAMASIRSWAAAAPNPSRRVATVGLVGFATTAVVAFGIATVSAPNARDYLDGKTELNSAPLTIPGAAEPAPSPTSPAATTPTTAPAPAPAAAQSPAAAVPAPPPPAPPVATGPITAQTPTTAVGDSLLVGAADELVTFMPATTVDAAVSRQAQEIFARIRERKAAGQLDSVVVIQTGTNGVVEKDDLTAMLQELSDRRRVVLVTSYGPHWWQADANQVMAEVAAAHPNVRIADFATAAAGHGEYFVEDGIHLTDVGVDVYAQLITAAVQGA